MLRLYGTTIALAGRRNTARGQDAFDKTGPMLREGMRHLEIWRMSCDPVLAGVL